jgi:hypothetical protein
VIVCNRWSSSLPGRLPFDALPRYKSTPRVAVRVVLLYEAEIVAEVEIRTKDVLTVKVAPVAPAGTITLEGTLAAPLLLERKT